MPISLSLFLSLLEISEFPPAPSAVLITKRFTRLRLAVMLMHVAPHLQQQGHANDE